MAGALSKLLHLISHNGTGEKQPEPIDKIQLDAAQERLSIRTAQLDESVDELSEMIKRMKRRQTRRKE